MSLLYHFYIISYYVYIILYHFISFFNPVTSLLLVWIISYDNKNIIFDGEKVYSILSLIYFLRIQTLRVDQEYFINIYNNGKIKPAIVRVEQEYNNQEEKNNQEIATFFIITVQSQDNNENHMQLVIAQIDNKKIPIQIELNTKSGIMELSIDD